MDICFTFDKKYIQHVSVAIDSIIRSNDVSILKFHLIYSEISKREIKKLSKWVESFGCDVFLYCLSKKQYVFCPCKKNDRLPRIAYYRIAISDILPETVEKVLYLDPDVIVNGDLSQLFMTSVDSHPLAAVMVIKDYFNSGVLLLNLSYFRKHNLSKKLFDYIKNNKNAIEYHDQDALNAVLQKSWIKLPPKYNAGDILLTTLQNIINKDGAYLYTQSEIDEAIQKPVIIHYAGSFHYKPWYKYSLHSKQRLYLAHLKNTPYKTKKLKTNYILFLMYDKELPYQFLKNAVKKRIDLAFFSNKGFFNNFIKFMYNNVLTRKCLFEVITRIMYLKKRFFKNNLFFDVEVNL